MFNFFQLNFKRMHVLKWHSGAGIINDESRFIYTVQDTGDCLGLPILSRDTWGAAEPKLIENMTLPVTMFFIHHTATQSCDSTDSCGKLMRAIQRFHMNTRGTCILKIRSYSYLLCALGPRYNITVDIFVTSALLHVFLYIIYFLPQKSTIKHLLIQPVVQIWCCLVTGPI